MAKPIPALLSHAELVVAAAPASIEIHRNRILSELLHADALESTPSTTVSPTKEVKVPAARAKKPTEPLRAFKQVSVLTPSAPQETNISLTPALAETSPVMPSVAIEAPTAMPTQYEMITPEESYTDELFTIDSVEFPPLATNLELAPEMQTPFVEVVTLDSFKKLVENDFETAPELFAEDIAVSELKDSINAALEALAPEAETAIQNEYIAVQLTITELLTYLPDVIGVDSIEAQDWLPTDASELPLELIDTLLLRCEIILHSLGLPAEEADVQNLLRIIAPPQLLTVLFAVEPICPIDEINPENKVSRTVPTDNIASRVAQRERHIVALGRKILALHPTRLQISLYNTA